MAAILNDNDIIALYFARDEQAIAETAARYGPYCYKVASNILHAHEDSEECVNDTWMNAWNAMPPKRPDVLRLFLAKITRSLAINRWKFQNAKKRGGGETPLVLEELEECVPGTANPEKEFLASELGSTIDRFVRNLPERDANVFVRRYFFTDSVGEIAAKYGLSEGNVSVILHRTRGKLAAHLAEEGY